MNSQSSSCLKIRCFLFMTLVLLLPGCRNPAAPPAPAEGWTLTAIARSLSPGTMHVLIGADCAWDSVGSEAAISGDGNRSAQATLNLNREGRYSFAAAGYQSVVTADGTAYATMDYGRVEEIAINGRTEPVEITLSTVGQPDVASSSPFIYSDYILADAPCWGGDGRNIVELYAKGDAASPILFQLGGSGQAGVFSDVSGSPVFSDWSTGVSQPADVTGMARIYVVAWPGAAGFLRITVTRTFAGVEQVSDHYLRITGSTPVEVSAE